MNHYNSIEVIDAEQWRKTFPLEKNLIHIGNGPGNDITLSSRASNGIGATWRFQLIALPTRPPSYRLVNLGTTNLALDSLGETPLAPRSLIDIQDGERIRVEDFHIVLHCTDTGSELTGIQQESDNIGLELFLPETRLGPDQEILGSVTVHNLGDNEQGAQFKLELQGLEEACYELGAGPLLFPGAQREVFLRLRHPQQPTPQAGERHFAIYATASEAYPGERASVQGNIYILPYYQHELRVVKEEES